MNPHFRLTKNSIGVEIIAKNDGVKIGHGYSGRQEMQTADSTKIQAKISAKDYATGVALKDTTNTEIVDKWCFSHSTDLYKFGFTIWTGTLTEGTYQIEVEWNAPVDGNRIYKTEIFLVKVGNQRK